MANIEHLADRFNTIYWVVMNTGVQDKPKAETEGVCRLTVALAMQIYGVCPNHGCKCLEANNAAKLYDDVVTMARRGYNTKCSQEEFARYVDSYTQLRVAQAIQNHKSD